MQTRRGRPGGKSVALGTQAVRGKAASCPGSFILECGFSTSLQQLPGFLFGEWKEINCLETLREKEAGPFFLHYSSLPPSSKIAHIFVWRGVVPQFVFKDPILCGASLPAPGLTLGPDLVNRKVGDYYLTTSGQ